jgi:hypothetical protein
MPPVYGMLHARIRHTAENFERRGVIIKPPQTVMSPPIENHRIGNVGDEGTRNFSLLRYFCQFVIIKPCTGPIMEICIAETPGI